jgi:hypothetical protein
VRNVLGFKKHLDARSDGTAKYPLPPEGQVRLEVPDETIMVAGRREPQKCKDPDADTLYWEEGWYIWYSRSESQTREHIDFMNYSVPSYFEYSEYAKKRREKWARSQRTGIPLDPIPVLPPLIDESYVFSSFLFTCSHGTFSHSAASTLIRLNAPYEPLSHAVENYLKPTYTLMETLKTSFQDGTQARFAKEVWETAWTQEPYRLMKNVVTKMSELWNSDGTDEDDG